jgi:2-keto-4-pentenoate hydratase
MTDQALTTKAERAAKLLLEARRSRQEIEGLPAELRPNDEAEAWAIQEALCAGLGGTQTGWKIGATSKRAQEFLGVKRPFPGRMFAETSYEAAPGQVVEIAADDYIFRLVEPEFALTLGRDLAPGAPPHDVADAVASVHPAIEIVTCAYGGAWTEVGGMALMADNGVHGAFVLGPGRPLVGFSDLPAHEAVLEVDGMETGRGTGAAVEGGGPLGGLAWLANFLAGFDRRLTAGTVVTTGVVTPFVELEKGQSAAADFGDLGRVELRFV